jgi:hypothetical protein
MDIISKGMGLKGEGQENAAGLVKQQDAKSRGKQRKGGKKAGFQPITPKHKEEVRKMIDKLRRELGEYSRKHRLNLSRLGETLEAYLRADGLTVWQAFLSLRGSARRKCKDVSS